MESCAIQSPATLLTAHRQHRHPLRLETKMNIDPVHSYYVEFCSLKLSVIWQALDVCEDILEPAFVMKQKETLALCLNGVDQELATDVIGWIETRYCTQAE